MQYGHCRGRQGALWGALTVEGYRAPVQEEARVGEEHMLGKAGGLRVSPFLAFYAGARSRLFPVQFLPHSASSC